MRFHSGTNLFLLIFSRAFDFINYALHTTSERISVSYSLIKIALAHKPAISLLTLPNAQLRESNKKSILF